MTITEKQRELPVEQQQRREVDQEEQHHHRRRRCAWSARKRRMASTSDVLRWISSPVAVLVVVGERQALDVIVQVVAQPVDRALSRAPPSGR